MMHLEPAAIRFMLEHLQESARRSGHFLPAFFHVFISMHKNLESDIEQSPLWNNQKGIQFYPIVTKIAFILNENFKKFGRHALGTPS